METSLLSVTSALPVELQAIRYIYELVNDFLKPLTVDSAVYYDLPRVLQVYGPTHHLTVRAMDGAAQRGRIDIVQWLIDNRTEGCSTKALTRAAANGYTDIVRLLWKSYMDRCHPGEALVSAATHGHEEVVVFLLDKCSMVMKALGLIAAAGNGHLPVVKVLPTDEFGLGIGKAVCEAALNGHVEVIAFFFERNEVIRDVNAATVLEKAISRGHLLLIQYVLDSAHASKWLLVHTLTLAIIAGRLATLRLLIKRADQRQLYRVLLRTSRNGQLKALEILVKSCEEFDFISSNDEELMKLYFDEALANAAKENRVDLVTLFVKKSSTASVQRVMIQATVCGFADIVKVLLETGICSNWHIYHALIVSSEHGWVKVVSTILETCTRQFSYKAKHCSGLDAIRSSLVKGVMYGHTEVVLLLLTTYESFSNEVAKEFQNAGDCLALVQPIDATFIRKAIKADGAYACPSILKLLPRQKNDLYYHDNGLKKIKAGEYFNDVVWL